MQVANKSILLLTCRSSPHTNPKMDAQARRKAVDLHNTDICLDVVPVTGNREAFHLERFYADLIKLAEDEVSLGVLPIEELSDSVLKKTRTKRSNGRLKLDLGGTVIAVSSFNLTRKMNKPPKQRMTADTNEEVTISLALSRKGTSSSSLLIIFIGEVIATLFSSKYWSTASAFGHELLCEVRWPQDSDDWR